MYRWRSGSFAVLRMTTLKCKGTGREAGLFAALRVTRRRGEAKRRRYLPAIGEDGFAAGAGEGVDEGERGEVGGAELGVIGEEEDAAGAGPELVEGGVGFEDGGGVGPEAAIPGAVEAAFYEADGLLGIEEQGGAGGEFAVDKDDVVWKGLFPLLGDDSVGEGFGAEDGVEAGEAFVNAEKEANGGGSEGQVGGEGVAGAANDVGDGADYEHAEG